MSCTYNGIYMSYTLCIVIYHFISALYIVLSCAITTYIYVRHRRVTSALARGWGLCHTLTDDGRSLVLGTWRSVPAAYDPVHECMNYDTATFSARLYYCL